MYRLGKRHFAEKVVEYSRILPRFKEVQKEMNLQVGDYAELEKSFSREDIHKFGEAIGDVQSRETLWKGDLVYGIATTALFTTLFRQIMPGALYMKQEVKFLAPLMIEEKVRVLILVK